MNELTLDDLLDNVKKYDEEGVNEVAKAYHYAHGQHIGRCESRISAALRHAERQAVFLPKP